MRTDDLVASLRVVISLLVLASVVFVTLNISIGLTTGSTLDQAAKQNEIPIAERTQIAPEASGTTIIAGQGFGGRSGWALLAISPDGRLRYYNDSYDDYGDVDPSPEGEETITYIATEVLNSSACGATKQCSRDVLVRTNLSTRESELLYSRKQAIEPGENIHDVDRIDDSLFVVSDIVYDTVYIVNTTTDLVVWQWSAQQDFPLSGGGPYPEDWTHMNDVEVVSEDRYMVSLRNQDQIVFLDKHDGVLPNLTLGADDTHEILFEQHNPDYIPAKNGGPAILVADSQNNRIVEYQRRDGEWVQSWIWRDATLRWPRDADRLPNGNTLITDSNGGRVFEVDRNGTIVWSVSITMPYEAERLETGDESTDGPSAARANLPSRVDTGTKSRLKTLVEGMLPPKAVNAIRFLYPGWASLYQVIAAAGVFSISVVWVGMELWATRLTITFRWPVTSIRLRSPVTFGSVDTDEGFEEHQR